MDSNLLKLTGLWKTETKKGSVMLKGSIRPGLSLVVLHNPDATGNAPEYTAFLAPSPKKDGESSEGSEPSAMPF
jgi:hypothetical protein